jgi:CRISPR-associated protein Cas1
MKKEYYLFSSGELKRKDNNVVFIKEDGISTIIPIQTISNIYVFGHMILSADLFNILNSCEINLHMFNWYGKYIGSYYHEKKSSGKVIVEQSKHYSHDKLRLELSKKFVLGANQNIQVNLNYYSKDSNEIDKNKKDIIIQNQEDILRYKESISDCNDISELMGIEANIRRKYYDCFNLILKNDFFMNGRSKQPPQDEVNALMSFGNVLTYSLCNSFINQTYLSNEISFLHELSVKRNSLSLDLAEIFKPIFVDRLIFRLINNNMIKKSNFNTNELGVFMNESGKRLFVQEWDAMLGKTVMNSKLGRNVTYKNLVKLECYKLVKHFMENEEYKPLKMDY